MSVKKTTINSRQLKALETKNALFDSAMELFLEHGFYNVRVDDIVEKAGTSKGTFYIHFKSKDQVIVDYYKNIDTRYVEVYNNLPENMSNSEKLLSILEEGYVFTEKIGKELLGVVLINQISGKEDIRHVTDPKRNIYKIVLNIVTEGQEQGEFSRKFDPEELTNLILNLHSGVFFTWKLVEGTNLTELGIRFFKLLMREVLVVNQNN